MKAAKDMLSLYSRQIKILRYIPGKSFGTSSMSYALRFQALAYQICGDHLFR
jgi:hypothetical protein